MQLRKLLSLACLALAACATAPKQPTPDEMMAAWQRAATPGAEHRKLDVFVGDWDVAIEFWMDPAAPPSKMQGVMRTEWMLDGHYLDQRYEGEMDGMPFQGRGTWGYDIAGQHYVGTWLDNSSTALMISRGRDLEGGKSFVLQTLGTDPVSGKPVEGFEEIRVESPDRHTMTMYEYRGSERVKSMHMVYTRRK
ncbi:MAG: DUF1579 domain-containing protein [Planctomycetaceae bacterium]|nr:DUF1579 domain-containing protein [Planctomycetaceae bacterium]